MVTAGEAYRRIQRLLAKAGIEASGFEAAQLVKFVTGAPHLLAEDLTEERWQRLAHLAKKRTTHYPLQYLLGSWGFMGLELEVGPGVLIPRPETEQVCEVALGELTQLQAPNVLDLCAGSGALALGIQKGKPQAEVAAVELDEAAFGYLQRNCSSFAGIWPRVPVAVRADALAFYATLPACSLDLIVCNPPYVTAAEYQCLAPELYFEPRMALEAPDEGLLFYKTIAKKYKKALKLGGLLVFEIGAGQAAAVQALLKKNAYREIGIRKDIGGLNRVAVAKA